MKKKNGNNSTTNLFALLTGTLVGGVLGVILNKRLQHKKYKKLIASSKSYSDVLHQQMEFQIHAVHNKARENESKRKDHDIMQDITNNIQQKIYQTNKLNQ